MERKLSRDENIRIVTCKKPPYNKTYIVINGGRREITKKGIEDYGLDKLVNDAKKVENITKEEMITIPLVGGKVYGKINRYSKCRNSDEKKSIFYSGLKGRGVEFGAAIKPAPVPYYCEVLYADKYDESTGCNVAFLGWGEFVPITYKTDLESMDGIQEESMNFIIHNHVLEHTINPIKALNNAYKKLKPGGELRFVIPDKNKIFDRYRKTTTIKHLKKDYEKYSVYREVLQLIESNLFQVKFYSAPIKRSISVVNSIRLGKLREIDYHRHVFSVSSLEKILQWYTTEICKWKSFYIEKETKGNFPNSTSEIYVRLIK